MTFGGVIWLVVRVVCYAALVIVVAEGISLFAPFVLELCSNQAGGTVKCTAPIYRSIYEFGFTVIVMTVFTGMPAPLALGGLGFLFRDVFWRRRTGG